ncbi:MAG TPA: hypothetical protein VH419_01820 [Nocardioidaceae bacterium]|jgi:hypothetical protein
MKIKKRTAAVLSAAGLAAAALPLTMAGHGEAAPDATHFRMIRSSGVVAAGCLEHAGARVTVTPKGPVEVMDIKAWGLPKRREFDLFVTQQPDAPFGMSWYQGDMESDKYGRASGHFVGRFNVETFIIAPGSVAAPTPHDELDADTNPATPPVHTFHLGLWFGSPRAAHAAGCPTTVTPFNGEHHAGIQALSTRQFAATEGPLGNIE